MATPTPADVQAKLDAAVTALEKTTSSGASFVKQHGTDWTKWPTSSRWYVACQNIYAARSEVGQLTEAKLTAAFTSK